LDGGDPTGRVYPWPDRQVETRALLCSDFAYGYPVDFGAALQAVTGKSDRDLPWNTVWQYLSEHLKDDEGTTPGAKRSQSLWGRWSNKAADAVAKSGSDKPGRAYDAHLHLQVV
jgi:hypothetical protein